MEKPVIPLIVQVRSLSTRYPKKALQPFADTSSMLEFLLRRLRRAFPATPIVVATTDNPADQAIEDIAEKNSIPCFRGDEQDVLKRFVDCSRYFHFTGHIARICSDNPFLQIGLLKNIIREAITAETPGDYISYSIGGIPAIRTHFGFFAEIVGVRALEYIHRTVQDAEYREHVTNYIYQPQTAGQFAIRWIDLPALAPYLDSTRLTIDTKEDFDNASFVYRSLQPTAAAGAAAGPEPEITWNQIINLLENHPDMQSGMHKQIRSYQK